MGCGPHIQKKTTESNRLTENLHPNANSGLQNDTAFNLSVNFDGIMKSDTRQLDFELMEVPETPYVMRLGVEVIHEMDMNEMTTRLFVGAQPSGESAAAVGKPAADCTQSRRTVPTAHC